MSNKEKASKEMKDQEETKDITQESKSNEQDKNKEKQEEEEEEVEVEEELEEKEDEEEEAEDGEKGENIPIQLPPKTENGLEISMELIKKFKEISNEENDEGISEFILDILYFHKLCVSFFKILNSLKKKNLEKIFLSSLKESYFLFADESIKHFNYKSLAKKIFPNLKKSQEEFLISVEFSNSSLDEAIIPTPSVFKINQKILELGLNSQGKLDIYSKIHILKALINFINLEKLKPYTKDFQQMENDLIKLYKNSQREKMTEEKYNEYVQIFTDGEKRDDWPKIISSCKKAIKKL